MAQRRNVVAVLDADPDLGEGLGEEELALARRYLVAEVWNLEPGDWESPPASAGLGVLLIEGLVSRSVEVGRASCAELLGHGDLLRPWQENPAGALLDSDSRWEVLEPTRLALLDRRFAMVAARWPELIETLMARAIRRSRALAFHMALSHFTRVDARLLALFWYLADRWGRVTPNGVVIPLRLTHHTLARLVGAQRPSVTTALGQLAEEGKLIRRGESGWLLHGEPPADLRQSLELAGVATGRRRPA
jgi:CRP/FNR family transcriptional regulator, cyclic AMP receptor protein